MSRNEKVDGLIANFRPTERSFAVPTYEGKDMGQYKLRKKDLSQIMPKLV